MITWIGKKSGSQLPRRFRTKLKSSAWRATLIVYNRAYVLRHSQSQRTFALFLSIRKSVLTGPKYQKFWVTEPPIRYKIELITSYEPLPVENGPLFIILRVLYIVLYIRKLWQRATLPLLSFRQRPLMALYQGQTTLSIRSFENLSHFPTRAQLSSN